MAKSAEAMSTRSRSVWDRSDAVLAMLQQPGFREGFQGRSPSVFVALRSAW